jgi:hypothetical protein
MWSPCLKLQNTRGSTYKVNNIQKGEEDDALEQLKGIESEVDILVKKANRNEKLSEEWGEIMSRANSLMSCIQALKVTYPTQRRSGQIRGRGCKSGITPT